MILFQRYIVWTLLLRIKPYLQCGGFPLSKKVYTMADILLHLNNIARKFKKTHWNSCYFIFITSFKDSLRITYHSHNTFWVVKNSALVIHNLDKINCDENSKQISTTDFFINFLNSWKEELICTLFDVIVFFFDNVFLKFISKVKMLQEQYFT